MSCAVNPSKGSTLGIWSETINAIFNYDPFSICYHISLTQYWPNTIKLGSIQKCQHFHKCTSVLSQTALILFWDCTPRQFWVMQIAWHASHVGCFVTLPGWSGSSSCMTVNCTPDSHSFSQLQGMVGFAIDAAWLLCIDMSEPESWPGIAGVACTGCFSTTFTTFTTLTVKDTLSYTHNNSWKCQIKIYLQSIR